MNLPGLHFNGKSVVSSVSGDAHLGSPRLKVTLTSIINGGGAAYAAKAAGVDRRNTNYPCVINSSSSLSVVP